jgi:hypothetical protein
MGASSYIRQRGSTSRYRVVHQALRIMAPRARSRRRRRFEFIAMLRPEYLSRKLTSPLPTKDGGTLRTIGEACEYMAAIGKERERRLHWQRVREVMLQEADEAAVTWRVQLAVLKDAKLDVTALSEPIERMMNEPPHRLTAKPGIVTQSGNELVLIAAHHRPGRFRRVRALERLRQGIDLVVMFTQWE